MRVAILVFEGCDLLDVGGPYEVLLTANRVVAGRGEPEPFEVEHAPGRRHPRRPDRSPHMDLDVWRSLSR